MVNLRLAKSRLARASLIEKKLGISLEAITSTFTDQERLVHCENLIGAVAVPVGVAGPLVLLTHEAKKTCFVPLATTEGALVASVNRGCRVIRESGGVSVSVTRAGTTRGPVFLAANAASARGVESWIYTNEQAIKEAAESTSNHLTYLKADVRTAGAYVFVRFYYDTDDAMGMNMVTIATQYVSEFIENETGAECLSVAGNYDIDKKPAWLNFIGRRGFSVTADVTVSKRVVGEVLKTTPESIFQVWLAKCMIGSAMSGAIGFNAHFSNIIAALYIATGQDPAHVVEGSHGISTFRVTDKGDLYMSVTLPAIMVATVGGGTKLKTQKEALQITGASHSSELSEVVGGAVLAGELSLMASLSNRSLAQVHKQLGR